MPVRFFSGFICLLFIASATDANARRNSPELKDIFFGEVLYNAYQDKYFDAISKLDAELGQFRTLDEPGLDPFSAHLGLAEFSVGDLELSYRMHKKAGRAIRAILNSDVDQTIRNEAAYRLARIYYKKKDPVNALHALELIVGRVPQSVRADEMFLRAQVYAATGRFEEAVVLLKKLKGNSKYTGFTEFNLGTTLIRGGEEKEGAAVLSQFGQMKTIRPEVLALRDKANLMLGYRLLEDGYAANARPFFERVSLEGPFSNRALLGSGWVDAALEKFDRALVPWTLLRERQKTNAPVQEALLAVPFAYSKLNVHSKAAIMYGEALKVFDAEVDRLNTSIKSIREGRFLAAILQNEADKDNHWLVNLRNLPDAPETHYILNLMASNDFQEFLLNYRDSADLYERNERWLGSLDVYEEIIEIRRTYFEPLLPVVEKQFKKLDSRMRLRIEQRDRLTGRLKAMLLSRRPEYLAYVDERLILDQLETIQSYFAANPADATAETNSRIKRLKGTLQWQINAEYDERLTQAYNHLHELDEIIDELNRVYRSFIRTRHAATQSYKGYSVQILQLRTKLKEAQLKLKSIMARQGRLLEALAVNEMEKRRERLEGYQIKARFALADSYDRANEAQELLKNQKIQREMQQKLKQQEQEKLKQQEQEKLQQQKKPEAEKKETAAQ